MLSCTAMPSSALGSYPAAWASNCQLHQPQLRRGSCTVVPLKARPARCFTHPLHLACRRDSMALLASDGRAAPRARLALRRRQRALRSSRGCRAHVAFRWCRTRLPAALHNCAFCMLRRVLFMLSSQTSSTLLLLQLRAHTVGCRRSSSTAHGPGDTPPGRNLRSQKTHPAPHRLAVTGTLVRSLFCS